MNQTTIREPVSIEGVGLHTGRRVSMTFKPAPVNHGYKFQRVDLPEQPIIRADVGSVVHTLRGTTLAKGEAKVWTVEHVLSALYGLQIDNVLIEIDGPEVPILDGSAAPFVEALQRAGLAEQEEERDFLEIGEPLSYADPNTGAELLALPADDFQVTTLIDFNSEILGQQYASIHSLDDYPTEIAPCRTFVFLHELDDLADQNLIKGGDLENAIVIVDKLMPQTQLDALARKLDKPTMEITRAGILNTTELQFQNEPARHKLLDVIGDLALVGKPIKGKIVATKPGHAANVEFAKILKRYYT
ncbi:MAG: UDP-3-O-[3-hydroxymyristoyl] N-acetylglucosamine deacetylase, partial [Bacteroidetes bacterium]